MGGWRHFGESLEPFSLAGNCGSVARGEDLPTLADVSLLRPAFPASSSSQPPSRDVPDALSRLVEAEILPRLMLAHRAPVRRTVDRPPNAHEIAAFSALLLAPGPVDIDAQVAAIRSGGLPLPRLLLDLLAPAARHLGALWEEDACDFLAVTEGLGRLQAISRRLCSQMEDETVPPAGRRILLMPCPGETHLFALSIVASFFREAGWDVTTAVPGPAVDPAGLLQADWFDVVGLSLSCEVFLPALVAVVPALRRASRNPELRVIVGGPYFARPGAEVGIVGADACVVDGRLAPGAAEALLDTHAVAC